MLNKFMSCTELRTVLKATSRMAIWGQTAVGVLLVGPHGRMADWELLPLPSIVREYPTGYC